MKSTYKPGMGSGPSAAALKSAPQKRTFTGDLTFSDLIGDKRVQAVLGIIVFAVVGYFGWGMLPEGTGKVVEGYKQMVQIHEDVEKKIAENPKRKDWEKFAKSTKEKTAAIVKTIAKNSHPAAQSLKKAKSNIDQAVAKVTPKDGEPKLKEAGQKLEDAKKALKL